MRPILLTVAAVFAVVSVSAGPPVPATPPGVARLLEDNGAALLPLLTNAAGDTGEGHVETGVVYSGKSSVKIVPMQRYERTIPGWSYRITKAPKLGEYRYLRYAWRADGNAGIMLQMHATDWNIRYTAGIDQFNWGTKFIAPTPPDRWEVVTRDLYADFGGLSITGIALTAFGGRAAYFDHIYLARTIDELDRIDATGLRNAELQPLTAAALDQQWAELASDKAPLTYLATWRLAAAPRQAVPYLHAKLSAGRGGTKAKEIRQWIRELDDDAFRVREAASKALAEHLEDAAGLLEEALLGGPSAEVEKRVKRLLARVPAATEDQARIERAVRVLEYAESAESRRCLEALAKGGGRVAAAAKAALRRLGTATR